MKANNVGDAKRCKMGQDQKEIETYCIMNFKDFDEIENCKVNFFYYRHLIISVMLVVIMSLVLSK